MPQNPLRERAKALGLTMREDRERIPPTRRAHEATEYARAHGKLEPFHRALLERYWSLGENLNDWEVLRGAARQVGLDPEEMQREVIAGQWRGALDAALKEAAELEIHSVPTFLIAGRYLVPGAQEAETFRQVFRRLGFTPKDNV